MNQSTAPGPDGLVTGFYSTFFDILGPLLKLVNCFLESGTKPPSFSAGRIVLIPKEGMTPSSPSSWRPITLLNTNYKLVATLLVRRVRIYLQDLVSPCQSCSVPGRSVFASLTLTRDVFEYACAKQITGAFVSLDQTKAFDCAEHGYLLAVLRSFGFPDEFVQLLRGLYADLSSELVRNGGIARNFPITRGVLVRGARSLRYSSYFRSTRCCVGSPRTGVFEVFQR